MKVLLIGGPLDGQRVDVHNAQANFISSQDKAQYVRATPSIFISVTIPQEDMVEFLAQKVIDGYDLVHRVGMALTQLDDAAMYTNIQASCHIIKAREILNG
jgi:hypothetical protein